MLASAHRFKSKPKPKRKPRTVSVKAWAVLCDGEVEMFNIYDNETTAEHEAQESFEINKLGRYEVVPCTITYTTPTKRRAK